MGVVVLAVQAVFGAVLFMLGLVIVSADASYMEYLAARHVSFGLVLCCAGMVITQMVLSILSTMSDK